MISSLPYPPPTQQIPGHSVLYTRYMKVVRNMFGYTAVGFNLKTWNAFRAHNATRFGTKNVKT